MIIIADAGSSKTDWLLMHKNSVVTQFTTEGINPCLLSSEKIISILEPKLASALRSHYSEINQVHFYGAGCLPGEPSNIIATSLEKLLPAVKSIDVYSDLLAAARATCGRNSGIVGILGTGSNSCYYDGDKIIDNVPSLGYILGDEGSGNALGRRLINAVFKRQLPSDLIEEFVNFYKVDLSDIINSVYKAPYANRYLASFAPFLYNHKDLPEIKALIEEEFSLFFKRNILNYRDYEINKLNFIGSIAYNFQDILRDVAEKFDYKINKIITAPISYLAEFHKYR